MVPNDPLQLVFMSLWNPLPHCIRLVFVTNRLKQIILLLRISYKWCCDFLFTLVLFLLGETATTSEEFYKEAHVIRKWGWQQQPARNWDFLPLAMWASQKVDIPDSIKPQDDCRTSQHLACNLLKDLAPEPLSSATPRFLTLRNYVTYYYYFCLFSC